MISVSHALDCPSLLSLAGLPAHRDCVAVHGEIWSGDRRVFSDGDVVCLSLYAAMRGEFRYKYHIIPHAHPVPGLPAPLGQKRGAVGIPHPRTGNRATGCF